MQTHGGPLCEVLMEPKAHMAFIMIVWYVCFLQGEAEWDFQDLSYAHLAPPTAPCPIANGIVHCLLEELYADASRSVG